MPKPLRVSVIATVSIQMNIADPDLLTDGVTTLEDGRGVGSGHDVGQGT